jgi:hypothetical protein
MFGVLVFDILVFDILVFDVLVFDVLVFDVLVSIYNSALKDARDYQHQTLVIPIY